MTFSWFGKLHAFFAVLFSKIMGKKAIVVAGDDDVSKYVVGGKSYGLFSHPIKKWIPRFTFRHADCVLPVSQYSRWETLHNAGANARRTRLIFHGFDCQIFAKPESTKKEHLVVTVGNIDSENYYRKGLKLFVESARFLPEIPFLLIGQAHDETLDLLKEIAPPNVAFTGQVPQRHLIDLLSRAAVYVQASEHEAFGCSVAEAMLCECVPVVSNRTALPEVVADCGFYVDELTSEALAAKIAEALQNLQVGWLAKQRIIDNFSLEKRKRELLQAVEAVIHNSRGGNEGSSLGAKG